MTGRPLVLEPALGTPSSAESGPTLLIKVLLKSKDGGVPPSGAVGGREVDHDAGRPVSSDAIKDFVHAPHDVLTIATCP